MPMEVARNAEISPTSVLTNKALSMLAFVKATRYQSKVNPTGGNTRYFVVVSDVAKMSAIGNNVKAHRK
jgi:hypothetical protein